MIGTEGRVFRMKDSYNKRYVPFYLIEWSVACFEAFHKKYKE